MDGLARVAGVIEKRITLGGRELVLSTPTLGAWASLESEFIRETNNVLEAAAHVASKIPAGQVATFWEQAHRVASQRCAVRMDDIASVPPFESVALQLFLLTRKHHATEFPTLESVREFLRTACHDVTLDALAQLFAHVVDGGLKNSLGPTGETTASNTSE